MGTTASRLLLLLMLILLTACSGTSRTDVVQSRINAVENNLLPAVVQRGSEPAGIILPILFSP